MCNDTVSLCSAKPSAVLVSVKVNGLEHCSYVLFHITALRTRLPVHWSSWHSGLKRCSLVLLLGTGLPDSCISVYILFCFSSIKCLTVVKVAQALRDKCQRFLAGQLPEHQLDVARAAGTLAAFNEPDANPTDEMSVDQSSLAAGTGMLPPFSES